MNQTRLLLISIIISVAIFAVACGMQPQPSLPPTAESTAIPTAEVSTAIPAETAAVAVTESVTDTPSGPSADNGKTVTLDDRGKTVSLAVGETFLLKLGEVYTWDISLSDESVISRVKNIMVIRGAQGVYQALKPGTATLTATGDPLCRQTKPACAMPSILFEVTLVVK